MKKLLLGGWRTLFDFKKGAVFVSVDWQTTSFQHVPQSFE
jgi:hypothetical protein